jgi:hypothetical protein
MSGSTGSLKKRLAALEARSQRMTGIAGIVFYDEVATGGTVLDTVDGRTLYGAEADAFIAAEIAAGRYDPNEGGIMAVHGICLDIALGRVPYPGGPYDELMRARGHVPPGEVAEVVVQGEEQPA